MADPIDMDGPAEGSDLWRVLRIMGLGLVAIVALGAVVGFAAASLEHDKPLGLIGGAVLAGFVLLAIGSLWLLVRQLRTRHGEAPPTRRERMNRNIILGSGALGAVISVVMTLSSDGGIAQANLFSSAPLPASVAIALVLVLGVLLPLLSLYWHRSVVDEQEAEAYKLGALFGLYVYMIGAPVWWIAWRGGLVPAPDGVAIYLITVATVGVIWLWKKYR